MGQAKQRGTFEERKAQAEQRRKERVEEWKKNNPPRVRSSGVDVVRLDDLLSQIAMASLHHGGRGY
jgi:hypothetical protein